MNGFSDKVSFIWSVADLLRGPYKPPQYGRVIFPVAVLRRLGRRKRRKKGRGHPLLDAATTCDASPYL